MSTPDRHAATRVAAIFDLDDTLLAGSSGKMMIRYLRSTGELTRYFRRRDLARTVALIAGWQMGVLDPYRAMEATARSPPAWMSRPCGRWCTVGLTTWSSMPSGRRRQRGWRGIANRVTSP
ncbi:MAG: hypothetical protein R3A10_20865 [Caldilineaceae bacterium]